MTPFVLFINLFLVPQIFCETQNRKFDDTEHPTASEVKVSVTPPHLAERPYDRSDLRKERENVISIPHTALPNSEPPTKPSTCENTELLIKLLNMLLELLGSQNLKFANYKYALTLMKNYLDNTPESPEKSKLMNKIENFEDNKYKKRSSEALRSSFEPRSQIIFKTEIPKINQQTCKETLENLIQNAYNTYLQLAAFPLCRQNSQYPNINLDFMKYLPHHKPQDLSFDVKPFSPDDFLYNQQIPNKDINLFCSHLNPAGTSNDFMNYVQNHGSNKNIDIISILQNYRPGQTLITGNSDLPNNDKYIEIKNNNNFPKVPSESSVVNFAKFYNPTDQQLYNYLTQYYSGNMNILSFFNNRNDKKQVEVPSQNLQLPVNDWKPPLNAMLGGINNQTVKYPTLEEIAQFLQGDKGLQGNAYKLINNNISHSASNELLNNLFPNTLVNAAPLKNKNYTVDNTPTHVIPKENKDEHDPYMNPKLNLLLVLLYKYLPKNNNGQFIALPNVNNLDELARLFPKNIFTLFFPTGNNPHKSLLNQVTLKKVINLIPAELLHYIFPNLNNYDNAHLPIENNSNKEETNSNTIENNSSSLSKDQSNRLFPNLNVHNNGNGNKKNDVHPNIDINTYNYQNILSYLDNNKLVINQHLPNTLNVHSGNYNTLQQVADNLNPNTQFDLLGSQLNPSGLAGYKIPDWQRLLAVTNFLKLHPRPNTADIIELTYLLKRPKPLIYQPYYYVKYKLPYITFINNMRRIMRINPSLRSNPTQLYQEIISISNVTDISPDLKGIGKEDVLELVLNSGALVSAKVLNGNDTYLNEQLKIIQNLTSEMQTEELLKLYNDDVKGNVKNETESGNLETLSIPNSFQTINSVPIKSNVYQSGNYYRLPFIMFNRVPLHYNSTSPSNPLQAASPVIDYPLQAA